MSTFLFDKLILDCNNIFHRYFHTTEKSKTLYKDAVRRTFEGIVKLEKTYSKSETIVYCMFDNSTSKSNLRSEISEDYKKERKKYPPEFYDAIETLKAMLLSYNDNYRVVYTSYLEADDLVLPLVESFKKSCSILMVSEDLDWARLIDYDGRDIKWLRKGQIVGSFNFEIEYGFKADLNTIIMYKAITGDVSDGIKPSIPNLKKEHARKLASDFADAYDLVQNYEKAEYLTNTFRMKIKENADEIIRNHKLVSFIALPDIKDNINEYVYVSRFKERSLKVYYQMLGIDFASDKRIKVQEKKTSLFQQDKMPRKRHR